MAEEKKQEVLDPIAYREDYPKSAIIGYDPMADLTPEYLENMDYGKEISGANQSFSQYWDDSSPEYQNKSKWWLNDKYTWEWVKNDQVNYDANLMLKDLNPNFVYWLASKVYWTDHPWYITQRNDQIASALYNEWKTSKDDVAYFLWQQKWWMNSSEADRANTIEAVYKRLWAIAEQNPREEEQPDLSKADDIVKDTSGKIYWKTTADEWEPREWINTLADANSVFRAMEMKRVDIVKEMVNMGIDNLAAMQYSWTNPYSETNWRDFRQYYPEMAALVDAKVKEMNVQDAVNAIAKWSSDYATSVADRTDVNSQATSYAVNNASGSTTATQLLKWIDAILESNDTAKSAQDLMGSIENDMAKLKNRLKNLREEVKADFKWDVADYIVNAAMNNRSQEIQNQLSILEDRYNAAYNRYKTELSHAEWQAEYDLKKDSLALDEWKAKNTITTSSSSTTNSNYTVAERNNNPTNMTVWFMQWAWAELWVDYEVSTDSFWSNGKQLYYAKLLWDPIDTTIRILDKAIAQGKNPFNTTSWSYINKLWLTVAKWNKMSQEEKQDMIRKWLPYEWWNMDNMEYYVNQSAASSSWQPSWYYNETYADIYSQFLQWKFFTDQRMNNAIKAVWASSVDDLRSQAEAWKQAQLSNDVAMDMLKAVEYLMSQWANKAQRQTAVADNWMWYTLWYLDRTVAWDAANYNYYYKYIKDNMTLEHLTDLKNRGATFWALSNQELDAIGSAASALWSQMSDSEFNAQLYRIYNKLRKNVWESELSEADFKDMIGAEDSENKRWLYITMYSDKDSRRDIFDKVSNQWTSNNDANDWLTN